MKNTVKIIALVFAVVMTAAVFAGCGENKTAITSADFIKAAAENGMTVEDAREIYTDPIFTDAQLAKKDGWSIVFFTIKSAEDAKSYFGTMKDFIEGKKTGAGSSKTTERDSWASYSQLNDGRYMYTCYIGSTMVFVDTDGTNKTAVEEFLKTIGY